MPCHESLNFTVGEARHESCHTVVGLGSHAVVLAVAHTVVQGGTGSGSHSDVMSVRVTQRCRGQELKQGDMQWSRGAAVMQEDRSGVVSHGVM
jgi:hypothetical protein